MLNLQTLGAMVRAPQTGEASPLAVPAAPRVAPVVAVPPVAGEGIEGESARSPASDAGRRFAAQEIPGATKDAQSPSASTLTSASAAPEATSEPATIVALGRQPAAAAALVLDGPPSTSLRLSDLAQLLDELRQSARPDAGSAAIRSTQPLAAGAHVDGNELALALKQSITRSGLFYESHLADWVMQRYPQADLQREPQAAWPATLGSVFVAEEPTSPVAMPPAATTSETGEAMPAARLVALAEVAVPVVRDQLQTLETRQLAWSGVVWAGQRASIAISEDEPGTEPAVPTGWRTRLTLELPHLGRIVADLFLRGTALQITLRMAGAAQATLAPSAVDDLAQTLRARAFDVSILSVAHGNAG